MIKNYSGASHLNVGTGTDVTIRELAELIAKVADYHGTFVLNTSKPDGTLRKVLDIRRLKALGWEARMPLELGLKLAYEAYASGLHAAQPA